MNQIRRMFYEYKNISIANTISAQFILLLTINNNIMNVFSS